MLLAQYLSYLIIELFSHKHIHKSLVDHNPEEQQFENYQLLYTGEKY